ncbi:MAG: hypothetical protein A2148_02245 [Chloroflexi bacterium RBG_16_68_14]|nr:MAG: hypothetical protein A2148_02245 [Chloroflexi bacterium RBG_16_68_14]
MTSRPGDDRERLVRDLEQARNELRASFQGLSDEQLTQTGAVGEWSVKDVLSHVASWEETALPDLARLARGDTPVLASIDLYAANFDPMNAMIMSLRRNLSLPQVLRELDILRADFLAAVARLPDSVLVEGQFGRVLVQITAEHDQEHAQHILEWRKQEGL